MLGSDSSTIVVIIRANERHRPIGSLNRLYTSLLPLIGGTEDRKSTRLNSSHSQISYAVFCLKKKTYVERAKKAGIDITVIREPNDGYWSNVWLKKPWAASYWGGRASEDWMFKYAYLERLPSY